MNLKEFKKKLEEHDWFYIFSDDTRKYDKGHASEMELKRLSYGKKTYLKAYEAKHKKMFPKKK
jgi:hypothetical protein